MKYSETILTDSRDRAVQPQNAQRDDVSPELTDALEILVDSVALTLGTCDWEPCSTSFALTLRSGESDFIVQDHGTIWTFRARSRAARVWWSENVEDGPCLGRNCCVEHRYAQQILDALQRDGFIALTGRSR